MKLLKSLLNSILEKGRKPFAIGTTRLWNGKEYQKTVDGWEEKTKHTEKEIKIKETTSKDIPEKSPIEKYSDERALEVLTMIGDALHAVDDTKEKNKMGFNKLDYANWFTTGVDLNKKRRILKKYKKQIVNAWGEQHYIASGLEDFQDIALVKPTLDTKFGNLIFPLEGIVAKKNFGSYVQLQKEFGLKWNGANRYWYLPKENINTFDFTKFADKLNALGIDLGDIPDLPKAEKIADKEYSVKKELTVDEAIEGIRYRKIEDTIVLKVLNDGKLAFYSDYNPEFNNIFSNKTGVLSGITEYNPNGHSRETYDLNLAQEALEKLKSRIPKSKIILDEKFKELQNAEAQKQAELQKPIPEVASKLAEGIQLFPYQNEGVRFLQKTNGNALIGDEMGLGKTLQSLAWAASENKKVLVVTPKVVRRTWLEEAQKFFPDYFKGKELIATNLRKGQEPDLTNVNIATVNYESLEKFLPYIEKAGFDTIIIDESHRIKNPKAKTTQTITEIAKKMPHKILLSGTAIKNKKEELFTQIKLVNPDLFHSKEQLRSGTIGGVWNKIQSNYIARQKSLVLKDLPEKSTTIVKQTIDKLPDVTGNMEIGDIAALRADLAIAKTPATLDFVNEILESSDSKVLLFTESVEAAKKLAESLGDIAILHHGQQSDDLREASKKQFQAEGSTKRVFVSTRQSLAVGATLTAADKVVFNDLPWTAADVRQAEDRAHRVGQKNNVNVYWVTAEGNFFDENISDIVKRKYNLSKKLNEGKQLSAEEKAWMEKPLDVKEILDAMKNKEGLKKALDLYLEKGRKPFPIGTRKVWGGQEYEKHSDGWVAVGGKHHGKLMGKFKDAPTHADKVSETKEPMEAEKQPELTKEQIISRAGKLGEQAFKNGAKAVPHHDKELTKLLANIQDFDTRIKAYKEWSTNWHTNNAKVGDELLKPKEQTNEQKIAANEKRIAEIEKILEEQKLKKEREAEAKKVEEEKKKIEAETKDKPLSDAEILAQKAHLMGVEAYIRAKAKTYGIDNIRYVSPRSKKAFKQLHLKAVKQAQAEGKAIPEEVLKEYPELSGLPSQLQDANQEKTNLFSSVDLKKVPKKRQAEIYDMLKDSNAVLATMGVRLKKPLHFKAASSLSKGDRKSTMATYNGGGSENRWIELKDITRASTSIMHEIGHAVDYAMTEDSAAFNTPRSQEISRGRTGNKELQAKYQELFDFITNTTHYKRGDWTAKHRMYLNKPTEIFARAFEVYSLGKALELQKKGKISKSFVDDYIPDVFKDPDSPQRQALLKEVEALDNQVSDSTKELSKELKKLVDEKEGGSIPESLAYFKQSEFIDNPKIKELTDKLIELKNQRVTKSSQVHQMDKWLISDEQKKQYIEKVSGLMEYILANEKIRKSKDLIELINLKKAFDYDKFKEKGTVIGHTKSGKTIHTHEEHNNHSEFEADDHKDAHEFHSNVVDSLKEKIEVYKKLDPNFTPPKSLIELAEHHSDKAGFHKDQIKGGKADEASDDQFDAEQLAMGIKVELEHTNDLTMAKEIAKDHLMEFPDYYTRLKEMENTASKVKKSDSPSPFYVGLVLVNSDASKIMLGKRSEDGIWTGVGGGANQGESPREAMVREAFEEANLILDAARLEELPTLNCKDNKVCHCFMYKLKSLSDITPKNDPDKEVKKWEWFNINNLPEDLNKDSNRLTAVNNAKLKLALNKGRGPDKQPRKRRGTGPDSSKLIDTDAFIISPEMEQRIKDNMIRHAELMETDPWVKQLVEEKNPVLEAKMQRLKDAVARKKN